MSTPNPLLPPRTWFKCKTERYSGAGRWLPFITLQECLQGVEGRKLIEYQTHQPIVTTDATKVVLFSLKIPDNVLVRLDMEVIGVGPDSRDPNPFNAQVMFECIRAAGGGVALFQYPYVNLPLYRNRLWGLEFELTNDSVIFHVIGENNVTISWDMVTRVTMYPTHANAPATVAYGTVNRLDYWGNVDGRKKEVNQLLGVGEVKTNTTAWVDILLFTPAATGYLRTDALFVAQDQAQQGGGTISVVATYFWDGAALTQLGSDRELVRQVQPSGLDARLRIEGTQVKAQVKGRSSQDTNWRAELDVFYYRGQLFGQATGQRRSQF